MPTIMKRILTLLFFSFVFFSARATELSANMTWCAFSTPDQKTYVETYISVIGNSVTYVKNKNGKYQAGIDVLMTFTKDDSIRSAQRYVLNSPEIDDSSKAVTFLDLQRFYLPLGIYNLQITLTDLHRVPQRPLTNRRTVIIDIDPDSVSMSDIELLESYSQSQSQNQLSKSGYDLVPYVSNFFPANMEQLRFYGEIYHAQKAVAPTDRFLVMYYIESNNGEKMNDFASFLKLSPQKINSFIYSFDITRLPSGLFNLVVEVRSPTNRLLSLRKTSFERFNPGISYKLNDLAAIDASKTFSGRITNPDTLKDYIRCLRPISSESEVDFAENQIKTGDVLLMQQYIYNFWTSRNPDNPEAEWRKYKVEVDKVNKEFGTQTMRGYETDRGRVYLQYGPPDQRVVVNNDPSSYPYEIWQYYTIRENPIVRSGTSGSGNTTQTNKKFVFADFDLVTNNLMLIHSDARGETRDDNWKVRLVKRDRPGNNVDQQSTDPQYGNHTDDWFSNPH
jgi:GWxTD domain-containing protein